ncbi:Fe-S cluster assembly protein SufE [Kineobactrum sediminis]|uniref:Fe-S cluster assembly protein SufE n=1 Tax=Kineobactrum sediminis TaxID=1905677 RepID=A0A2N5Y1T4_9GAMM|nr:SufE family protein [Kineobactrum sediminis]PLW82342.1 Fe-S cluster assembly protein SufE [Kineobactrum sediminis]
MSDTNQTPFGHSITSDDIVDTLSFFDDWEDRYKYIIDLGKELPPMPESLHTEERKIRGCQSQVWIDTQMEHGRLQLAVDSDAFIVKGLLGIVLAAYNNKTPAEVLAFDIDGYFDSLDLLQHLSPTRGNGLRAMVARIRDIAGAAAS